MGFSSRELQPLLLGTTSPDKLAELRLALAELGAPLLSPPELGLHLEIEEIGRTYRQNAALKARTYHSASGLITLAEDAGLEIDALDGQPGVNSARWEEDDYIRKNALILRLLASEAAERRGCRYVSELAIADGRGRLYYARGTVRGRVHGEARGQGGFGYDPIFYLPGLGKTMAELDPYQKSRVSHRGRAARRALPLLRRLLMEASP